MYITMHRVLFTVYFRQCFLLKLLSCIYKCKSCFVSELLFTFGILCSGAHVVARLLLHPAELSEEKAAGMSAPPGKQEGLRCHVTANLNTLEAAPAHYLALSVQMANIAEL